VASAPDTSAAAATKTTTTKATTKAAAPTPEPTKTNDTKPPTPEDDTTKEEKSDDKDDKGAMPVGNGGTVPEKYVWTQILSELCVTVPLPDNTRGRDLNVTIAKKHLKVGLKQPQPGGTLSTKWLVDAPLIKPIIMDDSFWTVEDGNRLVINLQKQHAVEWWDSVCVGDPKIDITKITPENSSISDLDGETRKTV